MDKRKIDRLSRGTYEHWHGEGSWSKANSWRKADWRGMVMGIIEEATKRPVLPSEMPMPPQPFRPYRADATDANPED